MAEAPKDYIESEPLDRRELAVALREAGIDNGHPRQPIDFEDWDGLTDDEVRMRVSHLGNRSLDLIYQPVVLHTEQQGRIVWALRAGDAGMVQRAHDMGVFKLLMGGVE
jgi:hypothetical protein